MKRILIILTLASLLSLTLWASNYSNDSSKYHKTNYNSFLQPLRYKPVKDTIYILNDRYISVSIKDQTATLVRRNDTSIVYPISSGSAKIHKGVDTPLGLFTVQLMARGAESRQFNNAKLYHWIGFNMNIGFHGLSGKGYYRYLGKRPSSHGCLRISREDGKALYQLVDPGVPVIVYDHAPARVLKFSDWSEYTPNQDIIIERNNSEQRNILDKRLDNLYMGKAYTKNIQKVFIDIDTIVKPYGFNIGNADSIPYKHDMPMDKIHLALRKDQLKEPNIFIELDTLSGE